MAVKMPIDLAQNGSTRQALQQVKVQGNHWHLPISLIIPPFVALRAQTRRKATGRPYHKRGPGTFLGGLIAVTRLWRELSHGGRLKRWPFTDILPRQITHEGVVLEHHIREGRFQRSLSLITAFSSLLAGLEVTYEHYIGSYNHWTALGVLGEILPWEDNRVELADETDHHGIRVAKVTFRLHDNDKKIAKAGVEKTTEILYAAGAEEVVEEPRYAHLVGAARMGSDPRTSVTDKWGRTHDIPNLFVCDGSLLPTQGSANPGLTIQALAARIADFLISNGADVMKRERRMVPVTNPPVRHNLSPRGTSGRGVPRLKSRR